jgi:hypothetical protein
MSDTDQGEVTFNKLGDAIEFVENKGKALRESAVGFEHSFKELTGFAPATTVSALDVVKICFSLYGEPIARELGGEAKH